MRVNQSVKDAQWQLAAGGTGILESVGIKNCLLGRFRYHYGCRERRKRR